MLTYINSDKNRLFMKVTYLFIILSLFISNVSATVLPYNSSTTTTYKTFLVDSDLCVLPTDCQNNLLQVDGYTIGIFKNKDVVEFPDSGNINIVLDEPINMNVSKIYEGGKSRFEIVLMYLLQPILAVLLFIFILLMVWSYSNYRKRKKGDW